MGYNPSIGKKWRVCNCLANVKEINTWCNNKLYIWNYFNLLFDLKKFNSCRLCRYICVCIKKISYMCIELYVWSSKFLPFKWGCYQVRKDSLDNHQDVLFRLYVVPRNWGPKKLIVMLILVVVLEFTIMQKNYCQVIPFEYSRYFSIKKKRMELKRLTWNQL